MMMNNDQLFNISKDIYKYFLYHNKKNISNTIIKNRVYDYLDSFIVDIEKRSYLYKIILLLLNLGLIDIKYCKNSIFYFSLTFPYYICKDSKKLLISPSLILGREYQINIQQPIKKLHNPALKILRQIESIKTLKKIIVNNMDRNYPENNFYTVEQWAGKKWQNSDGTSGLYRTNGRVYYYYLNNNSRMDVLPNDFLYSNAKTISYGLTKSYGLTNINPITIENNNKVKIECHINLLIIRALWADFMLNNLSNEDNDGNIKKIKRQFEKFENSETFENVSEDVIREIERIFELGI